MCTILHYSPIFFTEVGGSDSTLEAGYHNYPFSLKLPEQIPSSFESRCGSVEYYLEAILDCGFKSSFTVKEIFTVNTIIDLNAEPTARDGGELSKYR